ncbi:MAG TPA: DUF4924 domain-containing protein [Prevotella sp.]|jgi:hypothetical protein|uniref:DUF4924 family protein n=1 Tax=Prevotella sp. TaxID=59823 RepID=UPI000EBBC569|nr:DUF4924 family protein [Prevotella sp.]HAM28593.1 DUF4924 domain-containing protein [Prevotella sp.]
MFIAKSIREKSVVEYLLYMWQMEDLIRAYGCSLTRIRREYIDRFDYTDQQKDEEEDWFGDLIRMMNQEGKREKGHLAINEVLLQDLGDLHVRLLQSTRFPFYSAEYYRVLPFIVELRQKGDKEIGEVETCLNALYGVMLLRMRQKPISPETAHAIKAITTFLGMLSDYYIKDRTEGLEWEEH